MGYKAEKRYLAVSAADANKYIEYIMAARNVYIEKGSPIEDINAFLEKFLKLRKKLRA